MKKIIFIALLITFCSCGSQKQTNCDAYGSELQKINKINSEKIDKNEIG